MKSEFHYTIFKKCPLSKNPIIKKLLSPSNLKRFIFFFVFDFLIIIFSLYLSFLLRFEFVLSKDYQGLIFRVLPFFVVVKLSAFLSFRLYRISWTYFGLCDNWQVIKALLLSEVVLFSLTWGLTPIPSLLKFLPLPDLKGFPRSIFIIDGVISSFLMLSIRISKRFFLEIIREKRNGKKGKRTIIIGAGHTGEMILRDILKQRSSDFYPVGLLDDDKKKAGAFIHGVKVLGKVSELKSFVPKYGVKAVIIAIPSLNYKSLREIYNSARESNINTIKIVPRIYDFHKPDVNLKNLEEIRIEDLVGRQAVEINYKEIELFLKDKVILVTGAGGSIGSEIIMQVCLFQPERVILFDIDETELHNMKIKLKKELPYLSDRLSFIVGDIRDEERIDEVFRAFSPQIVFHAAAYKHVPMMEYNPKEAIKVNVFGTYRVVRASVDYSVQKFILISSDKAVRPTSIMGSTKRIAEYICMAFNDSVITEFVSVRFGNVLGSRGSVLPLFLEQLKNSGPLTVTHKEMKRYFMTIPEAVSLVLQASVIGKGGEVLVLDMGELVRIVKLAEELIKIHGLEPYEDIDIEFVGLRPGEKLFEEMLTAEEGTVASKHEKIFIAKNSVRYSKDEIEQILREFDIILKESLVGDKRKIKKLLKKYIRYF